MATPAARLSLLECMYQLYLADQNLEAFTSRISGRYSIGTLERIAERGSRISRRGAVLALGLLADFESNAVLGRALTDEDRGVRTLAEDALRAVWCRAGNQRERKHLATVIELNEARQFRPAIARATELIGRAPWFAEAWNQRAIGYFGCGRYAESIHDCQQALELNPYHFAAAAGMGQSYLQLRQFSGALESFRRALRLNPGLEGVRAQIASLERKLGQKP